MRTVVTPIDRRNHSEGFDRLIRSYDAATLRSRRTSGDPSELPVLIVGMIRSGTTLTEQILSSHPDVGAGGELKFWPGRGGFAFEPLLPTADVLDADATDPCDLLRTTSRTRGASPML